MIKGQLSEGLGRGGAFFVCEKMSGKRRLAVYLIPAGKETVHPGNGGCYGIPCFAVCARSEQCKPCEGVNLQRERRRGV